MHSATLRLVAVACCLLVAGPALAQVDVTFQVDMNAAIDNCALTAESQVGVPGSFNDWNTTATLLTDTNGDGIYTGTVSMEPGEIFYKFWGTDPVGWENNVSDTQENRNATITESTTLPVATFNKQFADLCAGPTHEIVFEVDMSIQELIGAFDPATDRVFVAGEFQGWVGDGANYELFPDPFDPAIYQAVIPAALDTPSENPYKFTVKDGPSGDVSWESGDNRLFFVTGDETDSDGNGLPEVFVQRRFFEDVSPDDILEEPATLRLEVDLRPAFYFLEDNNRLPNDTQTGEPVTQLTGVWINGPIAASSVEDTATDWATWGPDGLALITTRQLFDDGSNGDVTAGDSLYTRTYTYNAGTPRLRLGKFGASGYDNEAGFGADQHFRLQPGNQVITAIFGCIQRADGTFTSTNGPGNFPNAYGPYLLLDNDATPPTCAVVRSGGTSVEPTGSASEALTLGGNYPNPFAISTTFEYGIAEAGMVRLEVFDLMGRRVATLVDDVQAAATYRVVFDASDLASGTYVVRLSSGANAQTQRISVVR